MVRPFRFLTTGDTANTVIATYTGAVAEASCNGGTLTNARLRATADNGAVSVLNAAGTATAGSPDLDFDIGNTTSLRTADTQYSLAYTSAGGAQNATADYFANDAPPLVGGTFDCAIFGTTQVAA